MAGVSDFVNGVDQGCSPVWLKRDVKVDGGACGRVAEDLPVFRDGVPRVLGVNIVSMS